MNTQLIIYYGYLAIAILLPILYLISYKNHKSKHKNWGKAFTIAILILFLFLSVKGIAYLLNNDKLNCYLNNKCVNKIESGESTKKKTDNKRTTITTTTTTATTATGTTGKLPEESESSASLELELAAASSEVASSSAGATASGLSFAKPATVNVISIESFGVTMLGHSAYSP